MEKTILFSIEALIDTTYFVHIHNNILAIDANHLLQISELVSNFKLIFYQLNYYQLNQGRFLFSVRMLLCLQMCNSGSLFFLPRSEV